jgi:hypothetical protein
VEDGCLNRVGKYPGDANAILYIVATFNAPKARHLTKEKIADHADESQDLGRVSANLLIGEFIRAEGQ